MNRRAALAALAGAINAWPAPRKKYRAAVIGHTGHGNYGHGLDVVWQAFDWAEVVAVSDPDSGGLAKARERIGAKRGYSDYREMLAKEKPDIVSISPRWLDQRVAMVTAAAQAGAHIYCEKAFAMDLEQADKMAAAVKKAGVKLQIAHQMRGSPFVRRVREMVEAGEIGVIQEVRGRGKEDRRAGGEDLMVLGSHILDVMRIFLGNPQWVSAHVTEAGAELAAKHVRQATEPIGPIAGREIAAMFSFGNSVHGYFASKACDVTDPLRFGTHLMGSKGTIFLPNGIYPSGQPSILRSPAWVPGDKAQWEKIPVTVAGAESGIDGRLIANALMVADLVEAIEKDRKPLCNEDDGRWTIEMICGIYQAQRAKARVDLPLTERRHPLTQL